MADQRSPAPGRPFGPEPLWILGHNTNSIEAVNAALDQGANAVEIDVTAYAHDLNALCIDHAGLMGDDPGRASAPALEPFLRELREVEIGGVVRQACGQTSIGMRDRVGCGA